MPISAADQKRLLNEYERERGHYYNFSKSLASIENLLSQQRIQTHSVSFRGKDASSLAGKLRRPDNLMHL
jgi:hypothetical protein